MTVTTTRRGSLQVVSYPKVRRWGAFYVAEYRLRQMWKWRTSIIAFGLGNPVLYLTSVGIGVGALVDANTNGIDGVSYLMFLAPALLTAAAIQGAMDEVMFPTVEGFVWAKTFFAINSTAITARQIANGVTIAALVRTVSTALMYWAVLLAFGALDSPRAWLSVPAAIYCGWGFGAIMMMIASFVEKDDGVFALIGRFVITPMFLFSGTFYPLSTLPVGLQAVGWISPLWHATEIGRWLSYGHEVSQDMLVIHFAYLLVLGLIGTWITHRQYRKRLAR